MAEVAFLAQAYHWSLADVLDLEHADRHQFIELAAPPGDGAPTATAPSGWR